MGLGLIGGGGIAVRPILSIEVLLVFSMSELKLSMPMPDKVKFGGTAGDLGIMTRIEYRYIFNNL